MHIFGKTVENKQFISNTQPMTTSRKSDHISLAALSAPATSNSDLRFNYEPMLHGHPTQGIEVDFFGKKMKHPLWISSMTGGSAEAGRINHQLAEACAEFGLGIGLGSCRALLHSNEFFDDFNLRPILGPDRPLFANLGITQLEELLRNKASDRIHELVLHHLQADGLFIHVNPTQEWLQPEGDRQVHTAIDIIAEFTELVNKQYPVVVKEVGQGMGPKSLRALFQLPIDGVEFGAFGGTNFASIEIMRSKSGPTQFMFPLATIGHNADEMIECINQLYAENPLIRKQLIVSGGIRNFLDGYYYISKSKMPSLYGMANVMLQHALSSKTDLYDFIQSEIEGFKFASSFLTLRDHSE